MTLHNPPLRPGEHLFDLQCKPSHGVVMTVSGTIVAIDWGLPFLVHYTTFEVDEALDEMWAVVRNPYDLDDVDA